MAEKINLGWLKDYTGQKFAPKTLSTQILNTDGTSYKTTMDGTIANIQTQLDEKFSKGGGPVNGDVSVTGTVEAQDVYAYGGIQAEGDIYTDSAIVAAGGVCADDGLTINDQGGEGVDIICTHAPPKTILNFIGSASDEDISLAGIADIAASGTITSESTIIARALSADSDLYILEGGGEGVNINCTRPDGYTTLNFIGTSDEETVILSGLTDPLDADDAATKNYVDDYAVPTSRTVNGKALSANITLSASDVGAVSTSGGSTISNPNFGGQLTVNRSGTHTGDSVIKFTNDGGVTGYLGILGADGSPVYYDKDAAAINRLIHSGNYTNYAVPTSRTVNGKVLSADITLSASDVSARPSTWTPTAADVGAVPTSRTVNGKALSSNITLSAADVGAVSSDAVSSLSVKHADSATSAGGADMVQAPVVEGSILEWAVNVGDASTGYRNFSTNTKSTDVPDDSAAWAYASGTLHNRWGYRVLVLHSAWGTKIAYNKYSSNSGWSGWVVTDYDDQRLATLVPSIQISTNADINTIEYLKVGTYYCSSNGVAQTITNSPTGKAFMMQVYSPIELTLNNESTDTYVYRVRKIINYTGEEFIQAVSSESTAGTFYYGNWSQNATTTNHVHGMLRAYNAEPRRTDADFWSEDNGGLTKFLATGSMTNNKPMADGHIIHCFWDTTNGWDGQLFIPCSSAGKLQYRSKNGGTWEAWKTVLDSSNYTDYISSSGGGSAGMIEEFNTKLMSVSSYSPGVHASRFYIITLYNSSTANFKTVVLNWYGIYYIGSDHYYKDDSGNIMLGASMSNYVPTFTTSNNWTIKQVAGYY